MNVNIALNTIIIIMVFLFPGVLFRKFYFSGKFGNQFEQGNLLERFLWSLFLSFVSLSSVSLIFFLLGYFWDLHPLDNINFEKISSIFQSLSRNEFPNSFSNKSDFVSFLILIFIIYFISASLGYILNNIVRTLSFDKFSIFKFKNNWHYLSQAYKENGVNRKIGDVYTTFVDVLVKNNVKDELYRGILNNFILDKEDKLENIVLSNAYKFISIEKSEREKINEINKSIDSNENIFSMHRDYLHRTVYKKAIDGNLLVLSNENIININFTYVKTSNKVKYWKSRFYGALKIAFFLIFVALVILPFLQIKNSYFNLFWNKFVFSLTTLSILSVLLNLIGDLLKVKISSDGKTSFKDAIFIIIIFSTPYLWFFNLFSGVGAILVSFVIFLIFAAFQNDNKK